MSKKSAETKKPTLNRKSLSVVGPSVYLGVARRKNVPAKVDTGADVSSFWASNIRVKKDGTLKFSLFGPGSPFYTGKVIIRKDYEVMVVRSAMGQEQMRYRVEMPVRLGDRVIKATFSLADRSRNTFPVLIGRHTLQGEFLVDVSLPDVECATRPTPEPNLKKFKKNPYKFHKKYMQQ